MSNPKEEIIDKFLESHNMDYLFCILAEKESERLSILPDSVKKEFSEKITTMALRHTALNDVPDYIVEEVEEKDDTDYIGFDYTEEYEDDTKTKISNGFEVIDNINAGTEIYDEEYE